MGIDGSDIKKRRIENVIKAPSLINCPACGNNISINAVACPHCGEPLKATEPIIIKEKKAREPIGCCSGIILISLLLFIIGLFSSNTPTTTPTAKTKPAVPKTAEELRQEVIGKCFSGWDGSHRNLEMKIKDLMNDPDSYIHEETRHNDKGDRIVIYTKFRGKNSFGGVVREIATAESDLNCNIIETPIIVPQQ